MRTLIRNAHVVLPKGIESTSVVLDDGLITEISPRPLTTPDETVDADGYYLLPGVIDDQVHFRDPGLTHKEDLLTGSRACAKGGVTTFLEMPNTQPTTTSVDALHAKLDLAAGKCRVNYGFYIGATPTNVRELQKAERTPGIKIFIGSSTGDLLVDRQEALEQIFAATTLPICAHCEDEATVRANSARLGGGRRVSDHSLIRDEHAAIVATRRAVELAERFRHQFHVLHVSTALEAEFLKEAPSYVSAEVCPHHLFFSVDDYDRLGSLIQMNPSVKTKQDQKALWKALKDETIEVIATDHAPHTLDEKRKAYPKSPSGLPAVENSLSLMLNAVNNGMCDLEQVVRWMCEAPARIWHIKNKGLIEEGYDADLVLVDMSRKHTIRNESQLTKSKWSPWNGTELQGLPVRTWVHGHTAWIDGQMVDSVRGREVQYDRERPSEF